MINKEFLIYGASFISGFLFMAITQYILGVNSVILNATQFSMLVGMLVLYFAGLIFMSIFPKIKMV